MAHTSTKVLLLIVVALFAALFVVHDAQSSGADSDCMLRQMQAGSSVLDVNTRC